MNGILPKPGDILKCSQIKQPILLFWHFSRLATVIRCMKVHCHFAFQLGKITAVDVFRPQRVGKCSFQLRAPSSAGVLPPMGVQTSGGQRFAVATVRKSVIESVPGLSWLSRCVWETGPLSLQVSLVLHVCLPDKAWLPATRHNYTSLHWWDPVLHLQTDGKILSAAFRILFNKV